MSQICLYISLKSRTLWKSHFVLTTSMTPASKCGNFGPGFPKKSFSSFLFFLAKLQKVTKKNTELGMISKPSGQTYVVESRLLWTSRSLCLHSLWAWYHLLTLGLKIIHLRNILQNSQENNSEKSCRSCSLSGWTTTRIDALLCKVSELHLSYVRGRG